MKQLFRFIILQNKRLLKRPGFIAIFMLVPFFVIFILAVSKYDSNILKISVYSGGDSKAIEAVNSLEKSGSVIKFTERKTDKEAIEDVKTGKADAAWVFEDGYTEKLIACVNEGKAGTLVTSYQPEDNPLLSLAMFRLNVVMYPQFMHEAYIQNAKKLIKDENINDNNLEAYYIANMQDFSLFELRYLDNSTEENEKIGYLTSPLRGMLALWIMLTAMAATLYYMHDEKEGLFEWVNIKYRTFVAGIYIAVPVADAAIVMLIAMIVTGINVSILSELINVFFLTLNCCLFSSLLKLMLKSQERFAASIPVLMLAMIILCPVFISLNNLRWAQALFPPFYYLNATHSRMFTLFTVAYSAILGIIAIITTFVKEASTDR